MLHIAFDRTDENITGNNTVFRREAIGKIVRIEDLGIGREFVVAFPDQNSHFVVTYKMKLKTDIAKSSIETN